MRASLVIGTVLMASIIALPFDEVAEKIKEHILPCNNPVVKRTHCEETKFLIDCYEQVLALRFPAGKAVDKIKDLTTKMRKSLPTACPRDHLKQLKRNATECIKERKITTVRNQYCAKEEIKLTCLKRAKSFAVGKAALDYLRESISQLIFYLHMHSCVGDHLKPLKRNVRECIKERKITTVRNQYCANGEIKLICLKREKSFAVGKAALDYLRDNIFQLRIKLLINKCVENHVLRALEHYNTCTRTYVGNSCRTMKDRIACLEKATGKVLDRIKIYIEKKKQTWEEDCNREIPITVDWK